MSKVRVYELARDLNVETKVMLARLQKMGAKITNHQSTLTDEQVAALKQAFGNGAGTAAPSTAAAAATAASEAGKPKVVIRRRAAEAEAGATQPAVAADEVAAAAQAVRAEEAARVEPTPVAPPPAVVDEPEVVEVVTPTVTPVVEAPVVAAPVPQPVAAPIETPRTTPPPAARTETTATPQRPAATAAPTATPQRPTTAPAATTAAPQRPATNAPAASSAPQRPQGNAPAPGSAPQRAAGPGGEAPAPMTPAARRREVGGATIVRRATPEEVQNLESQNRQRHAGRKEDHRGTRVTGLGLLSNRVSSEQAGGPGGNMPPPSAPGEDDAWGNRRPASSGPLSARDRRAAEEEAEQKRKAAAAKKKGAAAAQGPLTTRALLEQAAELTDDFEGAEPAVEGEEGVVAEGAPVPAPVAPRQAAAPTRTVYTPSAPRNRRDLKRRKDLRKTNITQPRASYRVVEMEESISVGDLAKQLSVKASEVIKKLMSQGVMATINQVIDYDTAALIATEFGFEMKSIHTSDEDMMQQAVGTTADGAETIERPAIVTVMGHVDHGKTSILDAIRKADVAAGEAGGITQHIGAYTVMRDGRPITFLDTPGHAAFSAMRARGAKVTDIVILVVAADDGVMPQTIEAVSHAKAANVPIIVAVNKVDKQNLNFDRLYTELTEHGVQAEEWGGETQFLKVSALKRTGIEELLDAVLLQAEVLDLQARVTGPAEGTVIEAHLDKGRGPVATMIVQAGLLEVGHYVVAGTEIGRVRALHDHNGKDIRSAGPSIPVEIIGLSGVPRAGDLFNAVTDDKVARELVAQRQEKAKAASAAKSSASTMADLLARVSSQVIPEVPFIIKGDMQGSVEAIQESVTKTSTEKVKTRIIHAGVGAITESDITLAAATGAVLIGFNVRAGRGLEDTAEKQGVLIKYFSIIYEIVDTVKSLMVGKLPPVVKEVVLGHAEVRKPISVPKIGMIGGSAVTDGKITRSSHVRLVRENVVIYTGKIGSLRRFKDDVKEVAMGYECGIGIDGYNDLREGDVIEAYVLEESAATL